MSVAERGFYPPGEYAFVTGIIDRSVIDALVDHPLDDLNLTAQYDWGVSGLVINFKDDEDLALFTLAYSGPCASPIAC